MTSIEEKIVRLALAQKQFPREVRLAAAAITVSEMEFRPFFARVAEYTYAICLLLFKRDVSTLTLGVSQVSLRYFQDEYNLGVFQAVSASMSVQCNIVLCCGLLSKASIKSLDEAIQIYNGQGTWYYRRKVQNAYRDAFKFAEEIAPRRSNGCYF